MFIHKHFGVFWLTTYLSQAKAKCFILSIVFLSQMSIKGLLFPWSHGYLLALINCMHNLVTFNVIYKMRTSSNIKVEIA